MHMCKQGFCSGASLTWQHITGDLLPTFSSTNCGRTQGHRSLASLSLPQLMSCYMLQEGIYDAFADAVTKKVGELKQGGGLDPLTTLGPLIGHSAVERVRP